MTSFLLMAIIATGCMVLRNNVYFQFLFVRRESIFFIFLIFWLYYYIIRMLGYVSPRVKGWNLRSFDLVHRHKYEMPDFIDKGFNDVSKDDKFWKMMHERFSYAASQGYRPYMEDRMHYMYDPNLNLAIFGIFDGHGGMYISDYLECHFAVSLRHRLMRLRQRKVSKRESCENFVDDPIAEAVITEVYELDDAISRLDKKYTSLTGSTLICAILEKNRYLSIINVGDSRAVACDIHNRAVPLSRDHKPDDKDERRRVEVAGGFVNWDDGAARVQGILSVSRAFGDTLLKRLGVLTARPDVQRIDLHKKPLKFLIVGTDGFWDVISNTEAIKLANDYLISQGEEDWHRISTYLVQLALERQSKDNVSVLFLKLL